MSDLVEIKLFRFVYGPRLGYITLSSLIQTPRNKLLLLICIYDELTTTEAAGLNESSA